MTFIRRLVWNKAVKRTLCSAFLFFLPWLAFFLDIPNDGDDARAVVFLLFIVSIASLVIWLFYGSSVLLANLPHSRPVLKIGIALLTIPVIVFCLCMSVLGGVMVIDGLPFFAFVTLTYVGLSILFIVQIYAVLRGLIGEWGLSY